MDRIIIARDGFLYFKGAKIQARMVSGGLEFHEKDPRRAALVGGQIFIVPFESLLELIGPEILSNYLSNCMKKEGNHASTT